ncbi:MAG: glycoside hydrolase family 16 protein [Planctomycetota bacterium]
MSSTSTCRSSAAVAALSALLVLPGAAPRPTAVPDASEGYVLVWADEFNEPGRPNADNWDFEHGFKRNREAQWYQPDNAFVENGSLIIEGRRERIENPDYTPGASSWKQSRRYAEYTSASLNTAGRHEWLYGIFEMRAKIDARAGLWPAWWTLGSARSWPGCGEIDIMEYYDGDLLANACWAKRGGRWAQHWDAVRQPLDRLGGEAWASEFHVWRMEWTAESITIFVDDVLLNTIALSKTINPDGSNPFQEPHYMLVNLAIGGNNGGDPSETVFPSRYEIDYIRVYQKPETAGTP